MSRPINCPDIYCQNYSNCANCRLLLMDVARGGTPVDPFQSAADHLFGLVGTVDPYAKPEVIPGNTILYPPDIKINKLERLVNEANPAKVLSGFQFFNNSHLKLEGTIEAITVRDITPTAQDIVLEAGKYIQFPITIRGDVNLIPENIRSGVTIYGVTGTYGGGTVNNATISITATGQNSNTSFTTNDQNNKTIDLLTILGQSTHTV